MPELPDLEAIKDLLAPKLVGVGVERVDVHQSLVIRLPLPGEFTDVLTGNVFRKIDRQGKFLLFTFDTGHVLAIHLMLTGRLQYCDRKERLKPKTCLVFHLSNGMHLRYVDAKVMGKMYLVEKRGKMHLVPRWNEMGPDALDDALTLDVFRQRIRKQSGQIKNVLLSDKFVAGIGNAYADEILFEAQIYPYWSRASLSSQEIETLFHAMRSVLTQAIQMVAERLGEGIETEYRDFLKVHRKGGKPCPRCGTPISQIEANRRVTNFCRNCQGETPRGMFS